MYGYLGSCKDEDLHQLWIFQRDESKTPKIEVVGLVFEANGLVEEQEPKLERKPNKYLASIDDTSFMEIASASKGQPAAYLPCVH